MKNEIFKDSMKSGNNLHNSVKWMLEYASKSILNNVLGHQIKFGLCDIDCIKKLAFMPQLKIRFTVRNHIFNKHCIEII